MSEATETSYYDGESFLDFLRTRRGWLEVLTVQSNREKGYEIVLRLDGTYYPSDDAEPDDFVSPESIEQTRQFFEERIVAALAREGIPVRVRQL